MKLVIQTYSSIGTRPQNEDAIDIITNLDDSNKNIEIMNYCAIFDGHGGGAISQILTDQKKINISKYLCYKASPLANKLIKNNNTKSISHVFAHIQEKLKNDYIKSNTMGSTALISLIYPRNNNKLRLKMINLGDSRAVICSENNIAIPLTLDHKPHLYCEKNRIEKLGGLVTHHTNDDPRINGMSVSRSFGDLDNKYISQVPDVFDYNLTDEKFIIMCCDGVWDVVENQEAIDLVLTEYDKFKNKNKKIVDLKGKSEYNFAEKLANYALSKGTTDNVSVIIIFIM